MDPLFADAERQAAELSLLSAEPLELLGVLTKREVENRAQELQRLPVDAYVAAAVYPSEDPRRPGINWLMRNLDAQVLRESEAGPLYAAEAMFPLPDGSRRRIGILAQDRRRRNGVWTPEHHLRAVEIIRQFAARRLPVVTFMDTPGADAGEAANRQNQAHSISRLIAEFAQLDVPTVGIILGNGYSGGAIPLATTNVLLCVRDGVFNTIQPRGLASIARKYDLSWQECARSVGVSSYELRQSGIVDAIIDFVPGEAEEVRNLTAAIGSAIVQIEASARRFVAEYPKIFEHYRRSVMRFVAPSERLSKLQQAPLSRSENSTEQPTVFGCAYRHMRYLGLRRRIASTTTRQYGRLSNAEIPRGDLSRRATEEHERIFRNWLEHPLEIRYEKQLTRMWERYLHRRNELGTRRGGVKRLLFGTPESNYRTALRDLFLEFGFHLLNQWKGAAQSNFAALLDYLRRAESADASHIQSPTVLDVLQHEELRELFLTECENFLLFDLMYDNLLADIRHIAREAKDTNAISRASVSRLYENSLQRACAQLAKSEILASPGSQERSDLEYRFMVWIANFARRSRHTPMLKKVEVWKRLVHPRVSEPLFAIVTFYFERLLPSYFASRRSARPYDGRIQPRNIGIRDFWNRLALAYQDLLIHEQLQRLKKEKPVTAAMFLDRFCAEFAELDPDRMTGDPVRFPGFRISIEEALAKGIPPCGVITGIARLKTGSGRRVGIAVSNLEFQAGAFDMAGAEKFCRLLVECAQRRLPVVAFVSSGGMQTKEGAGALFPMAVLNDRITRFIRDIELPVICFGFGDCTGGAQASFVTHPLVQTYYLSGTNMPFAGQIVVPEHLPCAATLSNYLSREPGTMRGLVKHPFHENLDELLRSIDPRVPVPRETVAEAIERVLRFEIEAPEPSESVAHNEPRYIGAPFSRVMVHARGCAAEKIVRKAKELGLEVVLAQSDADMTSPAAKLLSPDRDQLVCIGGNTPAESYLNPMSMVRIAEQTGAQALHPGIGFLSESAAFARLCRAHGINFIGPPAESMDLMGNKSNAIKTAVQLGIPVVPGSHGIVTSEESAAKAAEATGYPVMIKAVHGGGGKGIAVVKSADDFLDAFRRVSAEARSAFGNGDLYLERFVASLRHVEVQVLRDTQGNTRVLGLRDCSVQRNHQKVIEESGSTMVPEAQRKAVLDYAAKIVDAIGYVGAGTVEFIYDLDCSELYFMEMNTRLQVEHPVTEAVSGVDIVAEQFRIAAGGSIRDLGVRSDGYAMELRINSERPAVDRAGALAFLPEPGKISVFRFPEEADIELIRGVDEGQSVTPYYDSMIVQLIGHADSRDAVIAKLRTYLDSVEVRGVCTNIPLLKRILDDPVFRGGNYDTGYLRQFTAQLEGAALIAEAQAAAGTGSTAVRVEALRVPGTDELRVPSPSPGIFYRSPSPNEREFVQPGDLVDSETTLCLLEAMKVFQSLTLSHFRAGDSPLFPADQKYEVTRVVPNNAQAVNVDDLLFVVRPVTQEIAKSYKAQG